MSDLPRLEEARTAFERRLHAVGPDDWGLPTPCGDWDVRQVVNHVVGHECRMALLLRGGTLEQFIAVREDDFLGDDAIGAWSRGCQVLDEAMKEPGALEHNVDYRVGPLTGRVLMDVRTFELIMHTWDLSRGIGFDEDIRESLTTWTLDQLDGPLRFMLQAFPDAPPVPAGLQGQQRLLALCGRSARRT